MVKFNHICHGVYLLQQLHNPELILSAQINNADQN